MVLVGLCIVGWLLVTAVLKDAARKKQRTELRRQIGIAEGLRRRWSTEDSDELAAETEKWANGVLAYLNTFDEAAGDQFASSAGFTKV